MTLRVKKLIGEVASEVSDGLFDEFEDFKAACLKSVQVLLEKITNNDPMITGMLSNMISGTFANFIKHSYEFHKRQELSQQAQAQSQDPQVLQAQQLLEEINEIQLEAPANLPSLSDSYKKGGFSK